MSSRWSGWANPRRSALFRDEYEIPRDAPESRGNQFHPARTTLFPLCIEFLTAHLLEDEAEVVKVVGGGLILPLLQINFGKGRGIRHVVDQLINTRQWVPVPLGDVVEGAVINAQL